MYAIQEPGATTQVRATPRRRKDLQRDFRGMESRDGQKEVAGTSWIAIEECEKDSGCGTTTKRRDEKMMLHITMANPTDRHVLDVTSS